MECVMIHEPVSSRSKKNPEFVHKYLQGLKEMLNFDLSEDFIKLLKEEPDFKVNDISYHCGENIFIRIRSDGTLEWGLKELLKDLIGI